MVAPKPTPTLLVTVPLPCVLLLLLHLLLLLRLLLQDVEGLPSGACGNSSSIRDVKRSKKGEVSWLMSTTYLTR